MTTLAYTGNGLYWIDGTGSPLCVVYANRQKGYVYMYHCVNGRMLWLALEKERIVLRQFDGAPPVSRIGLFKISEGSLTIAYTFMSIVITDSARLYVCRTPNGYVLTNTGAGYGKQYTVGRIRVSDGGVVDSMEFLPEIVTVVPWKVMTDRLILKGPEGGLLAYAGSNGYVDSSKDDANSFRIRYANARRVVFNLYHVIDGVQHWLVYEGGRVITKTFKTEPNHVGVSLFRISDGKYPSLLIVMSYIELYVHEHIDSRLINFSKVDRASKADYAMVQDTTGYTWNYWPRAAIVDTQDAEPIERKPIEVAPETGSTLRPIVETELTPITEIESMLGPIGVEGLRLRINWRSPVK